MVVLMPLIFEINREVMVSLLVKTPRALQNVWGRVGFVRAA